MILAEKISTLRKQNGWSQEELAEKLDISRQSVSKWELGATIPDIDKIIKMSKLFGVSTDYLLKDELEEIVFSETDEAETFERDKARSVSVEEANEFMDCTESVSKKIALAVAALIMSPVMLIFLAGLAEYNQVISEDMAGGIGTAILLVVIAAGVAVLILNGMRLSRFDYLEKEMLSLQYGAEGIVEKRKQDFAAEYRAAIAAGVVLCIIGVVPLLLAAAFTEEDFVLICCLDILLLLIACGVYLFVRFGMIQASYEKLLQTGDYTEEKKKLNKKTASFPGIYWCTVTAVYLAISLWKNNWDISWIIWPVAGVLFVALYGIVQVIAGKHKK